MQILVINSGSSSLKFSIYAAAPLDSSAEPAALLEGELSGIGGSHASLTVKGDAAGAQAGTHAAPKAADPAAAAGLVLDLIAKPGMPEFQAVGYRVVHPGPKLVGHQRITPAVLAELDQAISFAPLHDPVVLAVIRSAMECYPRLAHFACFDTEFHRTMPDEASVYAIPKSFRDAGVRRYGFHGLSCESVIDQLRRRAEGVPARLVLAHLGSGCSVTALRDGRSIDTSMGLTPDGGVVMGTRPGDLDPGLVLYLLRQQIGKPEDTLAKVEALLNHDSGMVALSGLENNMQAVRQAAEQGDRAALLALKVFTRCLTKTIGGYAWLLGGVDAIVFTGGIGEHDAATREETLRGLETVGVHLEDALNQAKGNGVREINASDSTTGILIVPAQEDLMIAMHVAHMAQRNM